jgi:hypothetical protein
MMPLQLQRWSENDEIQIRLFHAYRDIHNYLEFNSLRTGKRAAGGAAAGSTGATAAGIWPGKYAYVCRPTGRNAGVAPGYVHLEEFL